jgi:Glycosyl hydrolase family 99
VLSRRQFLNAVSAPAALGLFAQGGRIRHQAPTGLAVPRRPAGYPEYEVFDAGAVGRVLRERFPDLRNHFIFEYYPWYATNPWRHWNEAGRTPPYDIAATSVPALGPYDSRDPQVVEQHARWIVESGIGAIDVSWWGRGSYEDRAVPLLMDVMHDHGLKVTFHLEPYSSARTDLYASDIQYLLTEYGDKRHWDCQLLLRDANGDEGPLFKSFATLVGSQSTDCHGRTTAVPMWRPDAVWRQQTDTVREMVRRDFDHIHLLSDATDVGRGRATGFDGVAPYSGYSADGFPATAHACSEAGLVYSFPISTGFDAIVQRNVPADSCYKPPKFQPSAEIDWNNSSDREQARVLALWQIEASMRTSLNVQTDPSLFDAKAGFFLTYINTFNEWFEGTSIEPMKDRGALLPQELPFDYHNPTYGRYRLDYLTPRLAQILEG